MSRIIILWLLILVVIISGCMEDNRDLDKNTEYYISKNCSEVDKFVKQFREGECIEEVDHWLCDVK